MNFTEEYDERNEFHGRHDYEQLYAFIKLMVKDKVFSGFYKERRLIESLSTYKDIIEIDKNNEEFIKCLGKVTEAVRRKYGEVTISISREENGNYSLWTNFSEVAFGSYWFMIKNISIENSVVSFHIKCLRLINVHSEPSSASMESNESSSSIFNMSATQFGETFIRNFSQTATRENFVNTMKFISVIILTMAVGVYHLLELLLKYFRELTHLIQVLIPVFLAIIDGLTKAFGGLLILISSMWNGGKSTNVQNFPNPNLQQRYLKYKDNQQSWQQQPRTFSNRRW